VARPTKFTRDRQDLILQALRTTGCTLRGAAAAGGVSHGILSEWLKRGREAESGPYRIFYDQVQEAIAASESLLAGKVAAAADRDWKAAAWLLERRFPHLYAPQVNLVRHVEKLSDAQLEALIQEQLSQLQPSLPAPSLPPPGLATPDAPSSPGGEGEAEPILDAEFTVDS
jgi:hypothetical protein